MKFYILARSASLCVLAVALLTTPAIAEEKARAVGGKNIVQGAMTANVAAVGRVRNPTKIDLHGYRADFYVEQVLSGDVSIGNTIIIAWEELAKERDVRFQNEEVVLVILSPLPTQSLWRKRFKKKDRGARIIASGGEAFVRSPSPGTANILQHFLAMTPAMRTAGPGLIRLIDLVAEAETPVAKSALQVLSDHPEKLEKTTQGARWALAKSIADNTRDEGLRSETLAFIATVKLAGTRNLVAKIAEAEGPMQGDAWRALDSLDDGLPDEKIDELLTSPNSALRSVGASLARASARERLASSVRDDADATVRLSAVERLVTLFGEDSFDDVAPALADESIEVGAAAARALGPIGGSIPEKLRAIADKQPVPARERAVMALSLAGKEGRIALKELHLGHEDESVRKLAGLGLGIIEGHKH
ncbi:MAG: hypothetical protein ACI8TX_001700 [Hyphomicrobiaceae bacterium]